MSISSAVREQVRSRAGFACEYCQVRDVDLASVQTIDHFRPQSKGGTDTPENVAAT